MMQIAICDDEQVFLEDLLDKVRSNFNKSDTEVKINLYSDGIQLLQDCDKILYDVVFLDIEMPHINGIEVAEKLKEKNPYVLLIFITNRDDLVFQSLRYRPFRFIRKHWLVEELPEAIDAILDKFKADNQFFAISFNNSSIQLRITEIIYIESYKHDIYIYSKDQKYRIKSNLSKMEKEFEKHGFIRVHSGYLVNYRFIYAIDKTKVVLSNKEMIPLSRHRAETVKQKLQLFARGTDR